MVTQAQINSAVDRLNSFKGLHIAFPDGRYHGECSAPVVWLFKYLGIPVLPPMHGNRADGWGVSFPSELTPYLNHEVYQPTKSYPKGTLIIWNSPHIAVVVSDKGGNVLEVFEQNADPDGAPCQVANRVVDNQYHKATYALTWKIGSPAPAPAPQPPAVPVTEVVPAPFVPPSNIIYTKLEKPLELVTDKEPTHWWNLNFATYPQAKSMKELPKGTPFVAYAKAERTDLDHPCYYMTEADYHTATTTGANNNGINTVDLVLKPVPVVPAPTPEKPAASTVETVTEPTMPSDGDLIPVMVVPTDPNKWQRTFTAGLGIVKYKAAINGVVHDIARLHPDVPVVEEQPVAIAGKFIGPDGIEYYRTKVSVDNGTWYGFTSDMLTKGVSDNGDSDIEDILTFPDKPDVKVVKKTVVTTATIEGWFVRLLKWLHIIK